MPKTPQPKVNCVQSYNTTSNNSYRQYVNDFSPHLIWQILWRTELGLMMLTAIALFLEALNNGAKHNS